MMSTGCLAPRSGDAEGGGLCVVFAGGGTGGHLVPGLALADEMKRRSPGLRVVFFGTGRPVERRLVPRHGYELRALDAPRAPRSLGEWPTFPLRYWRCIREARRGLVELNARLVVGLGGYASVPAAKAAHRLGIPVVLLEQNSVPGKANRFLSRFAAEVYSQWPGAASRFAQPERVKVLGNPLRVGITQGDRGEALRCFGLEPGRTTLLVLGGSQGSRTVNRGVCEALGEMAGRGLQVIHQAGADDVGWVRQEYDSASLPGYAADFIDDMAGAYAASDVIVGRAGATTLAEVAAVGRPSILVPYPNAVNDHQRLNALSFVEAGAAVMILDAEFDGPALARTLDTLLGDKSRRDAMSQAAMKLAKPDATRDICDRIGALTGG